MGKNLVREFITDEFKVPVQAVLDQALHGEETANFGTYELVEEVPMLETYFYDVPQSILYCFLLHLLSHSILSSSIFQCHFQ